MSRGTRRQIFLAFTCDNECGHVNEIEITPAQDEEMNYVAGNDPLPAGWLMIHDSRDRSGADIPTHFFDKEACVVEWMNKQHAKLTAGFTRL